MKSFFISFFVQYFECNLLYLVLQIKQNTNPVVYDPRNKKMHHCSDPTKKYWIQLNKGPKDCLQKLIMLEKQGIQCLMIYFQIRSYKPKIFCSMGMTMRIEFYISLYNTLRFVQGGMIYDDETQYYEKVCSFVTLFEANFFVFWFRER